MLGIVLLRAADLYAVCFERIEANTASTKHYVVGFIFAMIALPVIFLNELGRGIKSVLQDYLER